MNRSEHARQLHAAGVDIQDIAETLEVGQAVVKQMLGRRAMNPGEKMRSKKAKHREWVLAQQATVRCGKCGGEWRGVLGDCREKFRRHRCEVAA